MPRKSTEEKVPIRREASRKRATGALKRFEDFARATDEVEILNPEGAWVANEGSPPTGSYHSWHGGKQIPGPQTYEITDYGCKLIEFYACNGLSQTTIAERLGLTGSMFSRCIRHQPEVAAALARGKADMEYELKDCLMGMARRGNVIAAIFLLKAQHGWRDNDPPPEAKPAVQVLINAPLTTEQYKELSAHNITPLHLPPPKADPTLEVTGELVEAN